MFSMSTPFGRMSIFRPVAETTKTDLIVDRLTRAIESGILKNGEKLPGEAHMAHLFAVSPITAREALEQLRTDGLVTTRRGRDGGSFVVSDPAGNISRLERSLLHMSTMELRDFQTYYTTLMSRSAQLAMHNIAHDGRNNLLDTLRTLIADLSSASASAHTDTGQPGDTAFSPGYHEMQLHLEIAAVTQSPSTVNALLELQNKLHHLLWLRFTDRNLASTLVGIYRQAEHDLIQRNSKSFEEHILTPINEGFAWLISRRIALRCAESGTRYRNAAHADTPEQVAHRIHKMFNAYAVILHQWDMDVTDAISRSVITKQEFDALSERLTRPFLEQHPESIGGGLIPSPDFLPDAPWHSSWWIAEHGSHETTTIKPLQVSSNPRSASFYDFTQQDWWVGPQQVDGLHITGPYIDYICSKEFALTLSRPFYANQRFAGVLGIDLSSKTVEDLADDQLATLKRPAAVVTGERYVIASTAVQLPCGTFVTDVPSTGAVSVVNCGPLGPANDTSTTAARESLTLLTF